MIVDHKTSQNYKLYRHDTIFKRGFLCFETDPFLGSIEHACVQLHEAWQLRSMDHV